MLEHRPFRYEAQAAAGFHDGASMYLPGKDLPPYIARYVQRHEEVHNRIFGQYPDALIHKAILIRLERSENDDERDRLKPLSEFFWTEMLEPHERAATYIGIVSLPDGIHRRALLGLLNDEYRAYYSFFDDRLSQVARSGSVRCAAAWAVSEWAFHSTRIADVKLHDAFDVDAYKRIAGPRERLNLWASEFDQERISGWIKSTIEEVANRHDASPEQVDDDEFWAGLSDVPTGKDIGPDLGQTLFDNLSREMKLETHPFDQQQTELIALILGNALLQKKLARNLRADSPILDDFDFIDRAHSGDAYRLTDVVTVMRDVPLDGYEYIFKKYRHRPTYISIAERSSDEFVVSVKYTVTDHLANHRGSPFVTDRVGLARFLEIAAHAVEARSLIAPIPIICNMSSLMKEGWVESIAPRYSLAIANVETIDSFYYKPMLVTLADISGQFANIVSAYTGNLQIRKVPRGIMGENSTFYCSVFRPDDMPVVLVHTASEVALEFHAPLVNKLSSEGKLRVTALPDGSPLLVSMMTATWLKNAELNVVPGYKIPSE